MHILYTLLLIGGVIFWVIVLIIVTAIVFAMVTPDRDEVVKWH